MSPETVTPRSRVAAPDPVGEEPPKRVKVSGHATLEHLGRYGLVVVLFAVIALFSIWKPETFFAWDNFRATLDQQSIIMMVAFAAMLPLIVGEFDLSVGANAGLASLLAVGLAQNQGLGVALALALAVAASTAIGAINGLIVTRLQVNSFIATLGMATLIAGIASLYTGGVDITDAPTALTDIGRAEVLGLPVGVLAAFATGAVLLVCLQKLPKGREFLAVGANRRAAELTGIRPQRQILIAFAAGGAVAGLGGALYGAALGSGTLSTGPTLLLPAFAGAFLGATAITPGRYNVIGTVVAVLVLAFTVSGLEQVGVDPWAQFVVQGGALIVAVTVSTWAIRARLARLRHAQLESLASTHRSGG